MSWHTEFFGLMRWLAARRHDAPPVGTAARPQQEDFRLGQQPSLAFAPREIARVRDSAEGWRISLFGLGLLGPNGPMPLQFTDFVRERVQAHQDTTLADFLDLFHHRYLSTFYRAWAINQSVISLDRPGAERFSDYIDQLAGCEYEAVSPLPPHARLSASAHWVREARNPEGIAGTLAHYFGVPVRVAEFVPRWMRIHHDDLCRLGAPGGASLLGGGAFAGEEILDRQHHFRLAIGPLSLREYLQFTPGGGHLPKLIAWVRGFVGFEFAWEVELSIAPQAAPGACLGSDVQLGWSSWLGEGASDQPSKGFVFEPELGIAQDTEVPTTSIN